MTHCQISNARTYCFVAKQVVNHQKAVINTDYRHVSSVECQSLHAVYNVMFKNATFAGYE